MNGQPTHNRTDLARAVTLLQPKLIADRLFADPAFCNEFGIDPGQAISFAGGPAISKGALYKAVRALFADQQPQTLTAITGEKLTLTLGADTVAISFTAEAEATATAHSLNLMLLSPNLEKRLTALDSITDELGPTGPDPKVWRRRVQQAPLDNDGMEEFWHQIDAALIPQMARISRDIMTGTLDKIHLVPRSFDYWRTLCGAPSLDMDQETWLEQVFEPHRRRLIERDLAKGLDLCLPMCLRGDLSLRSPVEHVTDDALWLALEQLKPIDDPFSLLGMADLALARAQRDQRFHDLAARTIERLCSEELRRADGLDIYALLPAVVDLVQAELRVIPHLASQPAYWRRLCAWTQTGLLIRAFQEVTFDANQFSENIRVVEPREARTAEFLDLRQSALSHPSETSRPSIHAEILGRVLILHEREKSEGKELPAADLFAEALRRKTEEAPMLVHMPGPLELDRLPYLEWEQLPEDARSELGERAGELTAAINDSNWLLFPHLSRVIRLDPAILARMTELVAVADLGTGENDYRESLGHMAAVAYAAVAQRNLALAEAILARCVQLVGPSTDEKQANALVTIGLIASAASGHAKPAADRLAQYLDNLALALPQGAPCRVLTEEIRTLRTFAPVEDWPRLSRAAALASIGS